MPFLLRGGGLPAGLPIGHRFENQTILVCLFGGAYDLIVRQRNVESIEDGLWHMERCQDEVLDAIALGVA